MEKLTLEDTINTISEAYAVLENAKSDCNDVVGSALNAYRGDDLSGLSKKERKALLASRKAEDRNIKKLAKAMMKGGKADLVAETDNMKDLTDAIA